MAEAPPPPAADDALRRRIAAAFPRNAAAAVTWEGTWALGSPCCMLWTVIPAYLLALDASKTLVQVMMVSFSLGAVLQLWGARLGQHPDRKRLVFLVWCGYCLAWIAYGVVASMGWAHLPRWVWVPLFVVTVSTVAACMNLGSPSYNALIVENTPLLRRGRFGALRMLTLGVCGMPGVLFAAWLMARGEAPVNFHHTFVIGGTILLLSCLSMLFIVDHAQAGAAHAPPPEPVLVAGRRLLGHLNFRVFLVFYAFFAVGATMAPMLIGYGKDVAGIPPSQVGWFSGAFFTGPILVGLFILPLADRWGFRLIAILCTGMGLTAFILPLLGGSNRWVLLVAYGLLAGSQNAMSVCLANIGLELVRGTKPAVILAVAGILIMPFSLVVAPLGGRLADAYGPVGYVAAFVLGATLSAASLVGFLFIVHEPRTGQEIYLRVRGTS
jgi:MFS family permease